MEHTVTEQITGVDIVQEQINIAAGLPLSYRQDQIERRGYAIQFRINAEDPKNDFLPNYGRITRYYSPGGTGRTHRRRDLHRLRVPAALRLDVRQAHCLSAHVEKSSRAGDARSWTWACTASKTTKPFHLQILSTPEFQAATFDTGFIEKHPKPIDYSIRRPPQDLAAVIAAALVAYHGL